MLFDDEPGGDCCLLVEGAAWQLKDTIAVTAVKMVMVSFPCPFVQGPQGRMIDRLEPPLIDQEFEVAVDRGLIERFHQSAPLVEDLLNAQGTILNKENLFDRCSL